MDKRAALFHSYFHAHRNLNIIFKWHDLMTGLIFVNWVWTASLPCMEILKSPGKDMELRFIVIVFIDAQPQCFSNAIRGMISQDETNGIEQEEEWQWPLHLPWVHFCVCLYEHGSGGCESPTTSHGQNLKLVGLWTNLIRHESPLYTTIFGSWTFLFHDIFTLPKFMYWDWEGEDGKTQLYANKDACLFSWSSPL